MPSDASAAGRRIGPDGRRLHPLTVAFATLRIARGMIWPAVVGGFSAGGGEVERVLPIFLGILAVPAVIGAVLTYVFYRWRLTPDELLLQQGVLSRRFRVIPLARVQNVEVRQNLAQRLAGVAELRVETAGAGREAEAQLSVLALREAQSVRAELLAHRRPASAPPTDGAEDAAAAPHAAAPAVPLARLSLWDVVVAGATANEAGVIAALLGSSLQFADELLPVPAVERFIEGIFSRAATAVDAAVALAIVAVLFLGWIISIVGAVMRYYGFTLARQGDELRKHYGMFTVHEASVPLERVQAIRLEESLLRRPLGLATLMIETAGGAPGAAGGAEAFVPITRRTDVPRLVRGILADFDLDAVRLRRVHPAAVRRLAWRHYRTLALVWAAFGVLWFLDLPGGGVARWSALLLPLPWLLARWQYANRGYALPEGYVIVQDGVMNRVTWIIPDAKLQTMHVSQNPFQRRLTTASLIVDTAAGGRQAAVVDVDAATARDAASALAARVRTAARAATRRRARVDEAVEEAAAEAMTPSGE